MIKFLVLCLFIGLCSADFGRRINRVSIQEPVKSSVRQEEVVEVEAQPSNREESSAYADEESDVPVYIAYKKESYAKPSSVKPSVSSAAKSRLVSQSTAEAPSYAYAAPGYVVPAPTPPTPFYVPQSPAGGHQQNYAVAAIPTHGAMIPYGEPLCILYAQGVLSQTPKNGGLPYDIPVCLKYVQAMVIKVS